MKYHVIYYVYDKDELIETGEYDTYSDIEGDKVADDLYWDVMYRLSLDKPKTERKILSGELKLELHYECKG